MRLLVHTVASVVFGVLFFGVGLFLPAWTFDYWQAWVFIAVFMLATLLLTGYLAVYNPDALRRRLNAGPTAESRPAQKVIMAATVLLVVAALVVSALDHRFGWSTVPLVVVMLGDVLVAVGLSVSQFVVVQNAYASATITVAAEQPLVDTGLYGFVRHPMYFGAVIMMIGMPLALDSLWGLLVVVLALPVLGARIVDEEKLLLEELPGYREYTERVTSRLVPGVW